MKKVMLKSAISGAVILAFASMSMRTLAPTISGKITPAEGADAVWAIQQTDTIKTTVTTDGTFQLEVKPGTWKLMVSAKAPYKNTEVTPVEVGDDKNTDVGEIKLAQ